MNLNECTLLARVPHQRPPTDNQRPPTQSNCMTCLAGFGEWKGEFSRKDKSAWNKQPGLKQAASDATGVPFDEDKEENGESRQHRDALTVVWWH